MKKIVLSLVMAATALLSNAQENKYDMSAPLPIDPNFRIGVLDNGLTYYIRNNNEPQGLASFYIIQKVGALLEEDNQDGLAHFLEHMAFNGTKHFEDKGIIKMLEGHGVAFGRDINAYTSLAQTVYNLSRVPVKNEQLIDSCLLILNDWSHYLTLSQEEIDSERGVIVEEWRTRNSATSRIRNAINAVVFEGSQYAIRDVIGDMDVVRNFEREELVAYYEKWYRPDLQAIAIIGDIDVDTIEQKVIDLFSRIPKAIDPEPLPKFPLKPRADIGFVCATDKEETRSQVRIYSINESQRPDTITHAYLREEYIQSIYNSLMNDRIAQMVREGSQSVNGGYAYFGDFVDGYTSFIMTISVKPNMEAEAVESVYKEVERARRFGFNASELEREKSSILTSLENSYKKKDKVDSDDYAREVVDMFIDNYPSVDIEYYKPFVEYLLSTITIDEINQAAKDFVTKTNMVITISGPEKNVIHATKEDILDAMARIEQAELDPYDDGVDNLELISGELRGSKISKSEDLDMFEAQKWTLENGINVIYSKADLDKNSVKVRAISKGGMSLIAQDDILSASVVADIMGSFGIGELDLTAYNKFMAGKSAGISFNIDELEESVYGSSSTKDFELMLQLMFLAFENPRFDSLQFENIMTRTATSWDMYDGTPDKIVQDSLSNLMTNYNPRNLILDGDKFRDLKLEDIERIYRDRFQNGADFTFYIVGDIDEQTARDMTEKYLGSISINDRLEDWVDLGIDMPEGYTERDIAIDFQTPKAMVVIRSKVDFKKYSRKLAFEMDMLKSILDLRFTTNIREAEGGTYGVSVRPEVEFEPRKEMIMTVRFECDPARSEQLKALVFEEFENIKENGVTQIELENVIKNYKKSIEQYSNSNNFVMNSLVRWNQHGIDTSDIDRTMEILDSISVKDIQRCANRIFSGKADLLDVTFRSK